VLPEDFWPRKVAHAARTLGMYDIDVEVIGIPVA
jgi:hypothetical protein